MQIVILKLNIVMSLVYIGKKTLPINVGVLTICIHRVEALMRGTGGDRKEEKKRGSLRAPAWRQEVEGWGWMGLETIR